MRRRTLLGAAALGLTSTSTGCIDRFTDGGDNVEPVQYQLREREIDDDRVLHHEASLTQSRLRSPENPVEVEVTLTNTGDDIYSYGERRQALYWSNAADGFYLLPKEEAEFEWSEELGYWMSPDGFVTTDDYQTAALEPGESHAESLALVLRHPAEEHPPDQPPDSLEFTTGYREYDGSEPDFEEDTVERRWGFTLERRS